MVRHIVAWNFKEGFSPAENAENAKKMKAALEALPGLISEIVELKLHIELLPTSNRDIVLSCLFRNEEDLKTYIDHPEHKKAGVLVRSVTQGRACADYYES